MKFINGRRAENDVRSVNGNGPTCGCGERSKLHVTTVDGDDIFLCRGHAIGAVLAYVTENGLADQGQPPGDYYARLMRRDHHNHFHPRRWCPDCQAHGRAEGEDRYGPRGTHVRSAEGSAIGRSRADAADLKRLVRSGSQRANRHAQGGRAEGEDR